MRGYSPMNRIAVVAAAGLALLAGPATAQDKTIKIGFISTFSGPAGAIGTDMKNAFELGLDHLGRKKTRAMQDRSSLRTLRSE